MFLRSNISSKERTKLHHTEMATFVWKIPKKLAISASAQSIDFYALEDLLWSLWLYWKGIHIFLKVYFIDKRTLLLPSLQKHFKLRFDFNCKEPNRYSRIGKFHRIFNSRFDILAWTNLYYHTNKHTIHQCDKDMNKLLFW